MGNFFVSMGKYVVKAKEKSFVKTELSQMQMVFRRFGGGKELLCTGKTMVCFACCAIKENEKSARKMDGLNIKTIGN